MKKVYVQSVEWIPLSQGVQIQGKQHKGWGFWGGGEEGVTRK